MVSAYIDAALARAKLPIGIVWDENHGSPAFWIVDSRAPDDPMGPNIWGFRTSREATDAYLSLVRELESQ